MDIIKGKVIVLGDDVDTDQILPGYAMAEPYDQLGNFAMAGLAGTDFKSVHTPGDIIVAGRNFGCGSSREQAPAVLKALGVKAVIAKSFARIFYRNAINIGLPVLISAELSDAVQDGDEAELDLTAGTVTAGGKVYACTKLPPYMQRILNAGGLIAVLNAEEA